MLDDPKFDHIVLAEKHKRMVFLAIFISVCIFLSPGLSLLLEIKLVNSL